MTDESCGNVTLPLNLQSPRMAGSLPGQSNAKPPAGRCKSTARPRGTCVDVPLAYSTALPPNSTLLTKSTTELDTAHALNPVLAGVPLRWDLAGVLDLAELHRERRHWALPMR